MININKHTIIEIIIIVIVATILAILYNFIRIDGVPFFPKSKEELLVSDGELFGIADSNTQPQYNNLTVNTVAEKPIDSSISAVIDTTAITTKADTNTATKQQDTGVDFTQLLQNAKRSSFGEYQVIDYEQMRKISTDKSGKFVIIDARRAGPYSKKHIGNAINICPYDSTDIVMERIAALPSNKTIIVYCDGGDCDSSHEISNILQSMGFKRFYIYEGGWEEWEKH